MSTRYRHWLFVALAAFLLLALAGWHRYWKVREAIFLDELHLVGFTTSMIGGPDPGKVKTAQAQADALGIDLFSAYQAHLTDGPRFSLACLLIDRQSSEYFDYCRENIADVPWPEVRVWRVMVDDDALTAVTRDRILDLLLISPTSEAKLFAGKWYRDQNQHTESEDAYFAAMTNGEFWDALDAADQLLDSDRYRKDAISHHLRVLTREEDFTWRSAASLVHAYKLEELKPLLEAAKVERGYGPKRRELVRQLKQHSAADLGVIDCGFIYCSFNVVGAFHAWLAPHLLAAFAPLGIWLLRRNDWQVSLRTLLIIMVSFAVFAWMIADRLRTIVDSPVPFIYAGEYLTSVAGTVIVVFAISLGVTAVLTRFVRLPYPG